MGSWVNLLARFTPEALLFEALAICLLLGGYAVFWVLRKRRLGVIDTAVPAGVVKGHLLELIDNAESLRRQLFGLLGAPGAPAQPGSVTAQDPRLALKVTELESKMADQGRAMDSLLAAKSALEKELGQAKAAGAGAAASAGQDSGKAAELQAKVQSLEAKLAEYSVIEDDLANLKRLQQENAQLRAALGGGGAPPAAATPAPQPAAAVAAAAAVDAIAEPVIEALAPAAPEAAPEAAPSFEGLVDQVEQSLQPAAPEEVLTEATPLAAAEPPPAAEPEQRSEPSVDAMVDTAGGAKSDADLVAEFEKMLNT